MKGVVFNNSGSRRNFIGIIILLKFRKIQAYWCFSWYMVIKALFDSLKIFRGTYLYLFYWNLSIFGKSEHDLLKNENEFKKKSFLELCTNSSATHSCRFRIWKIEIQRGDTFWMRPLTRIKIRFFDNVETKSNNFSKSFLASLPTFCPVSIS